MAPPAIRAVIVDDEPLARTAIREQLRQWPDVEVAAEAADGASAVEVILSTKPDLLFLDIRMPKLDGFEVLERVVDAWVPIVVFVTAYDTYALKAFDANAVDYLVKPFSVARFQSTMSRVQTRLASATESQTHQSLIAILDRRGTKQKRYLSRFAVQHRGRIVLVPTADVDWFESAANYVTLHAGALSYLVRTTMNQLEQDLDPARFARIHRATIVQIDRIREIVPRWHDYRVVLRDGTVRNMSRNYRDRLLASRRDARGA